MAKEQDNKAQNDAEKEEMLKKLGSNAKKVIGIIERLEKEQSDSAKTGK